MNIGTDEWVIIGLLGLLLAWVIWVLLRNKILGPPKFSKSDDQKKRHDA